MKDDKLFSSLTQMGHTQDVLSKMSAKLGDGNNNLYAYRPDGSRDPGMVWARVDGLGVCRVRCRKVTQKYGWPVRVAYAHDGVLEVVGEDGVKSIHFAGEWSGEVGSHRKSHDLLGSDPDFVQGLRLKPLLCRPTNTPGLSVYVEPYSYEYGGVRKSWLGGELDLTAEVPTTGSEQVLIVVCLDPSTNTLSYYTGTVVAPFVPGATGQPFTAADIDAIDTGADWQSAAIRSYAGQTQFLWPDWVMDRRGWIGTLETGVYVPTSLFDANTILKADADNTPEALTVSEQRLVGRITGGEITGLTAAEVKTLLAVDHGADLVAASLLDDDHTHYVINVPASSTRNVIQPTNAAYIPLTIKGAASQTASLLELHTSAGAVIATLAANGYATFGSSTTPAAPVTISLTRTDSATNMNGIQVTLNHNPAASSANNVAAGRLVSQATGSQNHTGFFEGLNGICANNGTGLISTGFGGRFSLQILSSGGMTAGTGFRVLSPFVSGAGTIGTLAGIYIEDQAIGTVANYALITNAGNVVFNEGGDASTDLRAESDTEANMILLDGSADLLYLGGSTNGVTIAKGGDVAFIGSGSGLAYGSYYGNEIGWSQATAAQDTWYEITDADTAAGKLNQVAFTDSELTVTPAGDYHVTWNASVEVSLPNKHVQVAIMVDGVAQDAGINHVEFVTANTQGTLGGNAPVSVGAGGVVSLAIRTTDTGTPDLAIDHIMLSLVQVGA